MFVFLEGNLTEDPVIRNVNDDGTAVVSFGVAEDQTSGPPGGPQVERVSFYRVTTWRGLAVNLAASCKKGDRILMAGNSKQSRWTDPTTQQGRSNIEFTATHIGPSLRWAQASLTKTAGRGITSAPVEGETAPVQAEPVMAGAPTPSPEEPF